MTRKQPNPSTFKFRKAAGTAFKPRRFNICAWCNLGLRPLSTGLCDDCVATFKQMLCSRKWSKHRRSFFSRKPYCGDCQKMGDPLGRATVLDHIKPWRFYPDLFWEESNHQGLCTTHHNAKTIREEGGFGRQRNIPGIATDSHEPISD